jgi:hypothetical protein
MGLNLQHQNAAAPVCAAITKAAIKRQPTFPVSRFKKTKSAFSALGGVAKLLKKGI